MVAPGGSVTSARTPLPACVALSIICSKRGGTCAELLCPPPLFASIVGVKGYVSPSFTSTMVFSSRKPGLRTTILCEPATTWISAGVTWSVFLPSRKMLAPSGSLLIFRVAPETTSTAVKEVVSPARTFWISFCETYPSLVKTNSWLPDFSSFTVMSVTHAGSVVPSTVTIAPRGIEIARACPVVALATGFGGVGSVAGAVAAGVVAAPDAGVVAGVVGFAADTALLILG